MNTSTAIDEFIAGRESWGQEQPAHHRHIITLFGLFGRPAGKAFPVAAIVHLIHLLGAEPSSIRSSISRLKKKGVLVSKKTHTGNGYALNEELEPHLQAGDVRIFTPTSASIGDPWLLVSFSVPETERKNRHKIRTGLSRIGFGAVASGLYIGPARLKAEISAYVREHELWDYMNFFICQPSGLMDLKNKIPKWWDLDAIAHAYQGFVDQYQPAIALWQDKIKQGQVDHAEAFKLYLPMMTQWRRLPYLDPGLPAELLPQNWIGFAARKVFNDLYRLLQAPATQYVMPLITS